MLALFAVSSVAVGAVDYEGEAERILGEVGLKGGLIVHVGCGGGELAAALGDEGGYIVHGLDGKAGNVEKARLLVREKGLYGRVSVDRLEGEKLPFVDNLVNLIIAEDLGDIRQAEAMRVLAPGGVLLTRRSGKWVKSIKPKPGNTDEWTHYMHDAGGNSVAHDDVVGPPGRMQWTDGPQHMRSHEHTPGINALVTSGGRVFYIEDQASTESLIQAPKWRLLARDAYNGIPLWQREIDSWYPHIINWGQAPRQLQRRLVACGDRVYVTLGLHSKLSAVDAATGDVLKVYGQTGGTEEVICHNGILLLAIRGITDERAAELAKMQKLVLKKGSALHKREKAEPIVKHFRSVDNKGPRAILAIDARTGKTLWKKQGAEASGLRPVTLCAEGNRVFYQLAGNVVCADLKTGDEKWSVASPPMRFVHDGSIVCIGGGKVILRSAKTGKAKWSQQMLLTDVRDAFIAGGSVWLGGFKPIKGKRGPSWGPYFATQRDMATGKVLMHIEPENPSHHHRCYYNKATDKYILAGRRGIEFFDLETGEVRWHSWVRGVCKYGIMPANGLVYAPPHACGCYIAAKLTSFNALAPMRDPKKQVERAEDILHRGPAYSDTSPGKSAPGDWPTYRRDAERSGRSGTKVPATLSRKWSADIGGKLSSLVVASGKVFAAAVDEHRIVALDADSGETAWDFTAGARVDSPPTIYRGRAIFGCRDGCVYSLRASDGELAWRLETNGHAQLITAYGQLESVLPIHGSVLVNDTTAYFTAGRSSYLDDGISLYRVNAKTGKVLSTNRIYSPEPGTGMQPAQEGPAYMPGALSDILSCDAEYVYLRDAVYDKTGKSLTKRNPHLFTLTGFLDDSWPHRSYWAYGRRCSLYTGCSGRDKDLVSGRILVFDERCVYGYGRSRVHWSNQFEDGPYRLFAVKRGEVKPLWEQRMSFQVRAMVLVDDVIFAAGPNEDGEATVLAVSAADGAKLAGCPIESSPIFDGMAAANGELYLSLENGRVLCLAENSKRKSP
jgi:outer membrane protein assembly factor BamB